MDNTKKFAIFLVLLAGFAALSFGETLYSFSTAYFRSSEQFHDEKYGRELDGICFKVLLNHYPDNFPLGWYMQANLGGYVTGYEWKEDSMASLSFYSSSDIRFSFGPSYRLKTGSIIIVPVSLGPVITNYREENYSYTSDNSGFYDAFNLGAMLNLSVVINPYRWFTIVNGLMVSYDFIRWEKGYMQTNYRDIYTGHFRQTNYGALSIGFYMGIGLRFENARPKGASVEAPSTPSETAPKD